MTDLNKCPECDYPTDHELELGEVYKCPNCGKITDLSIHSSELPSDKPLPN